MGIKGFIFVQMYPKGIMYTALVLTDKKLEVNWDYML